MTQVMTVLEKSDSFMPLTDMITFICTNCTEHIVQRFHIFSRFPYLFIVCAFRKKLKLDFFHASNCIMEKQHFPALTSSPVTCTDV